jgi:hypothetical protein
VGGWPSCVSGRGLWRLRSVMIERNLELDPGHPGYITLVAPTARR